MMDDQLKCQIKELQEQLRIISGIQPGGKKFYRNTFMMPNFIIDFLDYYLTPVESKVLHRAIREIIGWEDGQESDTNEVSISKMIRGHTKKDGDPGCLGIGLTHETVEKALNQLCVYRILKKESRTQRGVVFFFNRDTSDYNLEQMLKDLETRKEKGRQRMVNARRENPKVNP